MLTIKDIEKIASNREAVEKFDRLVKMYPNGYKTPETSRVYRQTVGEFRDNVNYIV